MLAYKGNGGSVTLSGNEVAYLDNWKLDISGSELDTTKFKDTDKRRQVGLKSGTGSGGGTFCTGDTNGQDALWTAYQNREAIALLLYIDGTIAITTSAIFTKLNFSDEVAGVAKITFDFETDGAVSITSF